MGAAGSGPGGRPKPGIPSLVFRGKPFLRFLEGANGTVLCPGKFPALTLHPGRGAPPSASLSHDFSHHRPTYPGDPGSGFAGGDRLCWVRPSTPRTVARSPNRISPEVEGARCRLAVPRTLGPRCGGLWAKAAVLRAPWVVGSGPGWSWGKVGDCWQTPRAQLSAECPPGGPCP